MAATSHPATGAIKKHKPAQPATLTRESKSAGYRGQGLGNAAVIRRCFSLPAPGRVIETLEFVTVTVQQASNVAYFISCHADHAPCKTMLMCAWVWSRYSEQGGRCLRTYASCRVNPTIACPMSKAAMCWVRSLLIPRTSMCLGMRVESVSSDAAIHAACLRAGHCNRFAHSLVSAHTAQAGLSCRSGQSPCRVSTDNTTACAWSPAGQSQCVPHHGAGPWGQPARAHLPCAGRGSHELRRHPAGGSGQVLGGRWALAVPGAVLKLPGQDCMPGIGACSTGQAWELKALGCAESSGVLQVRAHTSVAEHVLASGPCLCVHAYVQKRAWQGREQLSQAAAWSVD